MTDALPSDVAPDVAIVADAASDRSPHRFRRFNCILFHLAVWLLTLGIASMAVYDGLKLRRWTWDICGDIHFKSDITRGYGWGIQASGEQGYANLYDKMAWQQADWPLWLDYAPLRLGVMTVWAGHNRQTQPNPTEWQQEYDFNWPILWFNAGMEGVGVLAAFFLVRRWAILAGRPVIQSWPAEWWHRLRGRPMPVLIITPHPPFRGWGNGLAAALLLWFNPAMILSAHGWPTWDVWIVPMYLLAVLCGSYRCWLLAGMAMGVGAMFKGQQFIGVPVFFAWTLLNGDWRGAIRFACGTVLAITAVASPWLLTHIPSAELAKLYDNQRHFHGNAKNFDEFAAPAAQRVWNWLAISWAISAAVIAGCLPLARRAMNAMWRSAALWAAAVLMAAAMVFLPIRWRFHHRSALQWESGFDGAFLQLTAAFVVLAACAWFVRRPFSRGLLVVTSFAVALLAGMVYFDSSHAWWDCGIAYGTDHFRAMVMGYTYNLPALLINRYGWRNIEDVAFSVPWSNDANGAPQILAVTIRVLMRGLFVLSVIPLLWAIARTARRADPRFLIAVTSPWMMFYCLPTEIHERYLIYTAAIAAIWVGQSVGMTMLGVVLTILTWMASVHVMLSPRDSDWALGRNLHERYPDWFSPDAGITLHRFLDGCFPDAAWAVLLAGAVIIWMSVTTSRRPMRSPLES